MKKRDLIALLAENLSSQRQIKAILIESIEKLPDDAEVPSETLHDVISFISDRLNNESRRELFELNSKIAKNINQLEKGRHWPQLFGIESYARVASLRALKADARECTSMDPAIKSVEMVIQFSEMEREIQEKLMEYAASQGFINRPEDGEFRRE